MPITIKALTWNMGNKGPSEKAVMDVLMQIGHPPPTVLSISTQEELAPDGKRLQDKLLEKLNKGVSEDQQYVLVETKEPQYHTTMAGANNSLRTLSRALFTSENRVSTAILVKQPYKLDNATARIDYQPGKKDNDKKVNKSVITVEGTLKDGNGQTLMDIHVSGGHFDANKDIKRRHHANKFLEKSGLKTDQDKNFDEIYKEASAFRVVTGDFNERNQLFGDKKKIAQDRMKENNFKSYGFDVEKKPIMKRGKEILPGTYGLSGTEKPDPKKTRAHVAKGGFLDKVAYSTGLEVTTTADSHGFNVDPQFAKERKGKMLYHGSDHLPVMRTFEVSVPTPSQKAVIVKNYVLRRLPDFKEDIAHLTTLKNAKDIEALYAKLNELPLRHYDSEYSPEQFIRMYAGVGPDAPFEDIIKALQVRLAIKEESQKNVELIQSGVNVAAQSEQGKPYLALVFNQLTKCHELNNALQGIKSLSTEKMPSKDKEDLLRMAGEYVDKMYQAVSGQINGKKVEFPQNHLLTMLIQKYPDNPVIQDFDKLRKAILPKTKPPSLTQSFNKTKDVKSPWTAVDPAIPLPSGSPFRRTPKKP